MQLACCQTLWLQLPNQTSFFGGGGVLLSGYCRYYHYLRTTDKGRGKGKNLVGYYSRAHAGTGRSSGETHTRYLLLARTAYKEGKIKEEKRKKASEPKEQASKKRLGTASYAKVLHSVDTYQICLPLLCDVVLSSTTSTYQVSSLIALFPRKIGMGSEWQGRELTRPNFFSWLTVIEVSKEEEVVQRRTERTPR